METISGAIITSVTLVIVSFVAWVSQRATRESRLLSKVERFGKAYAAIPESSEKAALKDHFLKRVQELNNEFDEKPKRIAITVVTVATSVIGVGLVFVLTPKGGLEVTWISLVMGLVLGGVIGALNTALTWFINRRASAKAFDQRVQKFINGEA